MYGSQTPMYGSQTPMHGSRTPMYGSQTPTHGDGKTAHWIIYLYLCEIFLTKAALFFWHVAGSNIVPSTKIPDLVLKALIWPLATFTKAIIYSLLVLTLRRNSYLSELTQLGFLVLQEVVRLTMAQWRRPTILHAPHFTEEPGIQLSQIHLHAMKILITTLIHPPPHQG